MNSHVTIEEAAHRSLSKFGFTVSGIGAQISAILDLTVRYANRLKISGFHYKPYFIMSDAAIVAALVYAWAFAKHFPPASSYGLACSLLLALLAYKLGLMSRAAQGRPRARSFLQDSILFIIPTYLITCLMFRQPIALALTYMGTIMPLYGCFARIGCFLGGCCYGIPSKIGVLYPDILFENPVRSNCRRYVTSPKSDVRIFPIQLVEAFAQLSLFVLLTVRLWHILRPTGATFWIYLFLYSLVRIVLDCFRATSARPRYGRFSEAQMFSFLVQFACLCVLAYTGIDGP